MGMKSGKVLKATKAKAVARRKARPKASKSAAKAAPKAAKAAPKVVTKTITKTVTRTVEVDRNAAIRGLAQRIVDLTIANDDAASLALYADGIESREASMPASVGIDAIKQKFAMWRNMVTDAVFTPRSVVAEGKTIVIEWDGRVTLAASGRVVDFPEVAVHEIAGGKIVKERFYYDPSLLQG